MKPSITKQLKSKIVKQQHQRQHSLSDPKVLIPTFLCNVILIINKFLHTNFLRLYHHILYSLECINYCSHRNYNALWQFLQISSYSESLSYKIHLQFFF